MTTTTSALMTVLIDSKQPDVLSHLGYDGVTPLRVPLAAGSLNLIAHDGALLAIERLPVESLTMAIRRGTLSDRAAALKALTPWAYLVLVGDLASDRKGKAIIAGQPSGWEWRSVQGALATLQELGVVVLSCASDNQLGDLLVTLARRDRGPVKVAPPRETLFTTPAEQLLCAIPGIGEEKAEQLLTEYPSAAWALIALTNPDYAPKGVGPKTIASARAALGLHDSQQLCIDQISRPNLPD